ncbi:MAG: DNA mismatch repair protein MutS [Chitinivibrionales bacterium]|nr:DNA mismatch repair protein MutS [Chitinivibrionales bacterium]MBD3357504.1 DNA mismatch repair protein MutS [Chitinivibrionales bacterium]
MAAMAERYDPAEEILRYIDQHGVVDKDKSLARRGVKGGSRRSRGKKRSDREVLDLHGLITEEAERRVRMAVDRCRRRGIYELLIIHGRGYHSGEAGPVLKKMVRRMLAIELCHLIRDFVTASPRDGGGGATIVRFR